MISIQVFSVKEQHVFEWIKLLENFRKTITIETKKESISCAEIATTINEVSNSGRFET